MLVGVPVVVTRVPGSSAERVALRWGGIGEHLCWLQVTENLTWGLLNKKGFIFLSKILGVGSH